MTTKETVQSGRPPALIALDSYPLLRSSVESSLARQYARIAQQELHFHGRDHILANLNAIIHTQKGGLVVVDGPPGSGVTSLLAHLVVHHPFAFWFVDEDRQEGATALCAQLVGLSHLDVPLSPPAANSDPIAVVQFLAYIRAQRSTEDPIVLVIDAPTRLHPRHALLSSLLALMPANVLTIYGCTTGSELPFPPDARVTIPLVGNEVRHDLLLIGEHAGCHMSNTLLDAAQGNVLFALLASKMLQHGILHETSFPAGLDDLYEHWWATLDEQGQHLALLLGAIEEPIPIELATHLIGVDVQPLLDAWESLKLVEKVVQCQAIVVDEDSVVQCAPSSVMFSHWTLQDYIVRHQREALHHIHEKIVACALQLPHFKVIIEQKPSLASAQRVAFSSETITYLTQHCMYHAAWGTPYTRHTLLPQATQRVWVRTQERQKGTFVCAAHDALWELWVATEWLKTKVGDAPLLLRVVRSVALSGILVSLSRSLAADVAVAALHEAIKHVGRESGLKRVLQFVDQLPDGQGKALVLRQLGETCYGIGMKTSAMRLLSQALDFEEQKTSLAWRDQRNSLLTKLVEGALSLDSVDVARKISEYINHKEQRGMAETHIVRWLLAHGELVRARKVASGIDHESLAAWAMAEVVVAVARSGNVQMSEILMSDIQIETASLWAQIELACLLAMHQGDEAKARIESLSTSQQRDHGFARLAHTLALAGKSHEAFDVATRIEDVAVRVSALIDLRFHVHEIVAMLALKQADLAISELSRDIRVPLIAMLSAAYASLGHREHAMRIAQQLPEGEEQDRALSRVAVALVEYGDYSQGLAMARTLSDDDERDWTLAEIAVLLAQRGRWQESQARAHEIRDDKDRSNTLSNLAIALARQGSPLAALQLAHTIAIPQERARALVFIAPLLVQARHTREALSTFDAERKKFKEQDVRCLQSAQISRYLAAIAIALAEQGEIDQAHDLCRKIPQLSDQARVLLAIAQSALSTNRQRACDALGSALRLAIIDRAEAFRLLEQAAPILGCLGGSTLLKDIAAMLYEVDGW